MTVLPFRTFALAAAAALAGCASGHGTAFTAQSMAQSQDASRDPQQSLASGGSKGLAGGRGGSALGGSRRGSHGRTIYVSGNVPVPGRTVGQTVAATGLSGASASAKVSVGGTKLAVKTDPLGGQAGKVKAGGVSVALGDPVGGAGKTVLGKKGAATGVASAAGKAAGSLIGSASKGADAGVGGLIGPQKGGKHKKGGN